jgi:hypothetical protein
MPYTKVLEQLKENLQLAYRQAIDADARLDELKRAGHGNFNSIFTEDQGFAAKSNRFLPYVQELALNFDRLQDQTQLATEELERQVRLLGLLLQTLQAFKQHSK